MATIDMIAMGIYRISSFVPVWNITVNQFLIADDAPTLIHTGMYPMYDDVRKAIAQVLDPARLRYVVVLHFESDECGCMGRLLEAAPDAVLVCSRTGAAINLSQWDYSGPVLGVQDGDTLDLGMHSLRFLETPHVHHWDSLMLVEETTGSLFPADLFVQPGEQPAIVREDLGKQMCELYREIGIFAASEPVLRVLQRLERLGLQWVHPMHGGSLARDLWPKYAQALRTEPFAFDGTLLGKRLPE
ncbi:hypothetical protein EI42_01345 [Thermosporothrix hazakensis]|jgi:flavorubredoxin|uniref:Metallo-beta-lactamase domain-containing protein n=3 Tax=Thermosporothrix TaxID=768650 RepID=A0A326UCH0_THEHA|nr:hypothetical protein EI42_01345 [Thermosporothrix hazakensis]BBH85630.1 hypothetical protein KTC_03810 [Thermosporothrix sp. COM3]GCE45941.1 hypothetical protein KTH_08100 [Thermosporothrix hazakensis]